VVDYWVSGIARAPLLAPIHRGLSLGTDLKSIEIPYHRGLHRFALFTACATLVLIVAGALVTSNDAGLSVPDWPTTFGSFYKMPQMVGGIKYNMVIAWWRNS